MSFMRGEFDTAALQAMKGVEIAVREAAGLAASEIGTKLLRRPSTLIVAPSLTRQWNYRNVKH
jgi:hypothetical protein